jgi:hypothetical protein
MRFYIKYSSDYNWCNNGLGGANKQLRFLEDPSGDGASRSMVLQSDTDRWFLEGTYGLGDDTRINLEGNPPVDPNPDCVDNWCFVEICAGGEIRNQDGIVFEAWVRQVGGDEHSSYKERSLPDSPYTTSRNKMEAFIKNPDPPNTNCYGHRLYSHFLLASWDTDNGQTIGPALEFEGGEIVVPAPTTSLVLENTTTVNQDTVMVTSTLTGGVGPYQFLFDCGMDGDWNGVVDTSQPTAQHTCSFSGQSTLQVKTWAWDKTSDETTENVFTVEANHPPALGAPGPPVLVDP